MKKFLISLSQGTPVIISLVLMFIFGFGGFFVNSYMFNNEILAYLCDMAAAPAVALFVGTMILFMKEDFVSSYHDMNKLQKFSLIVVSIFAVTATTWLTLEMVFLIFNSEFILSNATGIIVLAFCSLVYFGIFNAGANKLEKVRERLGIS